MLRTPAISNIHQCKSSLEKGNYSFQKCLRASRLISYIDRPTSSSRDISAANLSSSRRCFERSCQRLIVWAKLRLFCRLLVPPDGVGENSCMHPASIKQSVARLMVLCSQITCHLPANLRFVGRAWIHVLTAFVTLALPFALEAWKPI